MQTKNSKISVRKSGNNDNFAAIAPTKSDIASMEYPIFSVSAKPDYRKRCYIKGPSKIEIIPSSLGSPTIFDKDILILCITKILKTPEMMLNAFVEFSGYELLTCLNRSVGGKSYHLLKSSLQRLKGSIIMTNVKTGGCLIESGFGFIESFQLIKDGDHVIGLNVKLSEWFFNSAKNMDVLTISPEYFKIKIPFDKRLYEVARKYCGHNKDGFKITIDTLKSKFPETITPKNFTRNLKKAISRNSLPDYNVNFNEKAQLITITLKELSPKEKRIKAENLSDPIKQEAESIILDKIKPEKEEIARKPIIEIDKELEQMFSSIRQLGLNQKKLEDLVRRHNIPIIKSAFELTKKNLHKSSVKNPAGFFIKACEEGWTEISVEPLDSSDKSNEVTREFDEKFEETIKNPAWREARKIVSEKIGIPAFHSWIKEIEFIAQKNNIIILQVQTRFAAEYLKRTYLPPLLAAWRQLNPNIIEVELTFIK